jgi:Fic family protein
MVFIEKKKENKKIKYYLAKTFRENKKVKKKRIFLGTDLNKEQLDKLASDAHILLGEIDLNKVLTTKEIKEFEEIKKQFNKIISDFDKKSFYELFVSEFTYDSNAIEGSTLTLDETNQVLFENISPKGKPLKHVQEAKNHKEAFDFLEKIKREKIDKELICKIQEKVVKKTIEKGIGELRQVNVRVGTHIAPPFYSVPRKFTNLIKWHNQNKDSFHPVVIALYFHAVFEEIHPFVDGNGRTGRLLLNYMLKQKRFPPVIIFFEQRQKYYSALEQARKNKNLKPLIKIILKSYKKMIKKYSN